MTTWRDFAYPFPDDDFETLDRVLGLLSDTASMETIFKPLPFFVATLVDPIAALYLRLAVGNGRPTDDDGRLIVGPNEIWVDREERAECERLLVECCPSAVVWSAFALMSFASEKAHRNFGCAYSKVTGLPAWAPPKQQSDGQSHLIAA
jgi:hypothetical protein